MTVEFIKFFKHLVHLSLMTKSTSIAIRIHFRNKRLQIIDNGMGIPSEILKLLGDKVNFIKDQENFTNSSQNEKFTYEYCHQILLCLRVCASTLIMTKHCFGNTYCKVLKFDCPSSIKQIKHRPSSGITWTIYFTRNFKILMKISKYKSIMKRLLARFPQVSYSIVINDDNKRHVLGKKKFFGKKSTPKFEQSRSYFQRTYYSSFGKFIAYPPGKMNNNWSFITKNRNNIQSNKKIISILKTVDEDKNNGRQCSSFLTNLSSHNALNHNTDTKNITITDDIEEDDDMKECSFVTASLSGCDHEIDGLESHSKLSNNHNKLNCKNDNINGDNLCIEVNPYNFDLSGEWSDWILESPSNQLEKESENNNDSNFKTINKKRYSFLPEKLNNLLPTNDNKLSTRKLSNVFREKYNLKFNLPRKQDDGVRLCNVKRGKDEITMDKKILQQIQVLNQVNLEFIACIAEYNNKKLLILIDQHAMDERIQYENLLDDYKTENNQLKSVTLKQSIKIAGLPINCAHILQTNRGLLANYGINFTSNYDNITNNNYTKRHDYATLLITTIPKCLFKKKYKNYVDLTYSVRELLNEITEKLCNNIGINRLPLTIHNAIASEACHGAIRFGDPLDLQQCNDLVSYWIETDLPNRCAHGRPVVIPLLFIDPLYKNQHNLTKESFKQFIDLIKLMFDILLQNKCVVS